MTLRPATLAWFARHEAGLVWRDWFWMMRSGSRRRWFVIGAVVLIAFALAHLIAAAFVAPWAASGIVADKSTLVMLTGTGTLFFALMLSQAMESVTRAYYARADLDLILSSPASSERLFAVRTGAVALSTLALSALLAGPAINVLALEDGPQWLMAYGVLAALSALATAVAVLFTLTLFRLVGAKRTRLIAQVVAAVVGAGFIVGLQAVAILSYGNISRFALFQSDSLIAAAPDPASLLWIPARAAMGDPAALFGTFAAAGLLLAMVIMVSSPSFARHATAAAGLSSTRVRQRPGHAGFRRRTALQTLRMKEWRLLMRDPWLVSQSLMQILYLVPPGLMLWLNYGDSAGVFIVVIPVLVMAAGQLAGGLAWLAVSGEDAHDLVVTAPIPPRLVLKAKIEAVLFAIGVIVTPLLFGIALSSMWLALATAIGIALAASSATAIQLWFRVQARRSMFRRRQVSSRTATISEAFASIMWAGTAALVAAGSWFAIGTGVIAFGVLGLAFVLSPRKARRA
jgi:ABC-2 type transport system permease protein